MTEILIDICNDILSDKDKNKDSKKTLPYY